MIPSNDDASKSIEKVLSYLTDSIAGGLADRKKSKEQEATPAAPKAAVKEPAAAVKAEAKKEEK